MSDRNPAAQPKPMSDLIAKYLRPEHLPHIWCAGCGNGIIVRDVIQAIENLGLDRDRTVIVSGIGCSSRAVGYMDFDTLHTTHGRAIAFATGIKLADPGLEVIVLTGDGDIAAIGGNHLIHAARRNIGLTVVVMNNTVYGMTGGQYSSTTPHFAYSTTTPYGNLERPLDIAELARCAGANYVARGSTYHVRQTIRMIEDGIRCKGFALIDVATICPTYYGQKNGIGGPVAMMRWQKEHAVTVEQAAGMDAEARQDKLVIGELHRAEFPEYSETYHAFLREQAEERGTNG